VNSPGFRTIREQIADRIRAHVLSGRLAQGASLREHAAIVEAIVEAIRRRDKRATVKALGANIQ
jgi:DNA-binding GntR family transcriptional regulator